MVLMQYLSTTVYHYYSTLSQTIFAVIQKKSAIKLTADFRNPRTLTNSDFRNPRTLSNGDFRNPRTLTSVDFEAIEVIT